MKDRTYEHITIISGSLTEEEKNKEIKRIKDYLKEKSVLNNIEDLGKKTLAYSVKGEKEGNYLQVYLKTSTKKIEEFENFLRQDDKILKFITMKTEEDIRIEDNNKTNDIANIYEEINELNEDHLFKGFAEQVAFRLSEMQDNGKNIDISIDEIYSITEIILKDDYIWEQINSKIDEKLNVVANLDKEEEEEI